MSKHEVVTTHTFTTEEGIKIVIEIVDDHFRGATIQFPGSGNRAFQIIPSELLDLAGIAQEASEFMKEHGFMPGRLLG